ncbi:MAG TPA: PilN domain-containing protein [Tepidisphaeraceae bacterium]|jgi:hypothetical protein
MRELDFVPPWYVSVRRHKRLLKLQASGMAVVGVVLLGWQFLVTKNVHAAERVLADREKQVESSADRVRERQTQQRLREQLQTQERVDTSLGLNVESSRLLAMLDAALPKQGSLTEVVIVTDEKLRTLAQQAASKQPGPAVAERRLRVSIKGVAPSKSDVATLMENLDATRFCEDRELVYSSDRVDGNHVMCEFHVSFSINLNVDGSAK